MRQKQKKPDLWLFERTARAQGHQVIAGVDEAGRGPLAGPVVAAAVILPMSCNTRGIYDSKQLTDEEREHAFNRILKMAIAYGVGVVDEKQIDKINILRATHRAMRAAISGMTVRADLYLIDGLPIPGFEYLHQAIVDGDCKSASIAAASIIAKVTRDRIMCKYDEIYPEYGFARHKGYTTEEHLEKLAIHGVCDIHRQSFEPVALEINPLWERTELPWVKAALEKKEKPRG